MTNQDKLTLFKSIFRGRTDVYPRRWEKNGKSGWSPAYSFDWNEFNAHRANGGSIKNFENKTLQPLTDIILLYHLSGKETIGIYPILPDNTSYFIAADFDEANWKIDSQKFVSECSKVNLQAYIEISRSGNGAHVWIFFDNAYPCWKSRSMVLEIIRKTFNYSEFDKEMSFDRLFPNQDTITDSGFGNLIALPLQGERVLHGASVFCDNANLTPYQDQWEFLQNIHRHTSLELDSAYDDIFVTKSTKAEISNSNNSSVYVILDGSIHLKKNELNGSTTTFIKEELNLYNKEYIIKKKLGKSIFSTEKYFNLIQDTGSEIVLPRGFFKKLTDHFDKEKITYKVKESYTKHKAVSFNSRITLRPEQEKILAEIKGKTNGIIIAPPGSGKTIIALQLIAELGLPALILVNRNQLLLQWIERTEQFLGIPKTQIGVISGVKKKVGGQITIATLQTLARYKDIKEIQNAFGVVIIDECHHIPAKTYREIITSFKSKFCYGLTATHERKFGQEIVTELCIGQVIAEIKKDSSNQDKTFNIQIINSTIELPFRYKNDHYEILAKTISYDTSRNKLILDAVLSHLKQNHKILLLTERKEHIEVLALHLRNQTEILTISGDDSLKQRKLKHAQIKSGNFKVLIATGQLLGEGFDMEGFDVLVLAFPIAFEGKLKQYIGRLRGVGIKYIIDIRDRYVEFIERQFKKRKTFYDKLENKI
ncbi:MAG: DEAD/DEAH box helicase family protein [bacterium]